MNSRTARHRIAPAVPRPSSGFIMVAVLVALLIASLLVVGLVRLAIIRARHARAQRHQLQAQWLAESACQRAQAQLRQSADYAGESWRIPATEWNAGYSAAIEIRVTPEDQAAGRYRIAVDAVFPVELPDRARVSHDTIVAVAPSTDSS